MYAVHLLFSKWFSNIVRLIIDLHAQVVSTLSVLEPVRRAPVGVPFLYQKVCQWLPISTILGKIIDAA